MEPQKKSTIIPAVEGKSLPEQIHYYVAERMNGIKVIGFDLRDGSNYEGTFPILTEKTIDLDMIQLISYYQDNPLVQKVVRELIEAMPEIEDDYGMIDVIINNGPKEPTVAQLA